MKKIIVNFLLNMLWKLADESSFETCCLYDLYDDIPSDIKNEVVDEYTFCCYNSSKRKRIINWLNNEK